MSDISKESREDKLQTQILREIVDAIKTTSRQEIREDRIGTEKRIQASKTVGELDPDVDPFEALKESLQQEYLSNLQREEIEQRTGAGFSRGMMTPIGLFGAQNEAQMVSQGLQSSGGMLQGMKGGLIAGAVLAVVGKVMGELIGGITDVEGSAKDYALFTGTRAKGVDLIRTVRDLRKYGTFRYDEDLKNGIGSLHRYGMKPSDALREYGQFEFIVTKKRFSIIRVRYSGINIFAKIWIWNYSNRNREIFA